MKKFFFTALSCCCLLLTVFSQTRVPAFFSDHMVLQQLQEVAVWGTDAPRSKITVTGSWGKKATATTDDKGQWKLKIQTPAAGGPYRLQVKGSTELTLQDVLVGEVWFCSGQSNMEMPVKGYLNQPVMGSNEAILNSANNQVRFFSAARATSITPLADVKGDWKIAAPATTGNFSATAYYFARKLQAQLGIPVGCIQSSWGGSTIESWMDKESLAAFTGKKIPDTLPATEPNKTPTIMYNSMLHPYIGYTIRGVIWYQGEGNRDNAAEYRSLFSTMVSSWRQQWGQGDFPFYFVQIAPFEPGKVNGAFLREAQLQSMLTVKNTGMAVTMDIGDQLVIHPSQKETAGNRLAYWALAKDYGMQGIAYSGPVYREMKQTSNGKIVLFFDYCDQGLTSFGKPLADFEIAGEDKQFYPAEAVIDRDKKGSITVSSERVPSPVHVRYAFRSWAQGSLFNTAGLPASSFRTDNW